MKTNKRLYNFIITVLVSAIGFIAIMAMMHIYPFGDASFLTGDLNGIYIPEYSYVKDILEGRAKWGFAFNKGMGGNTTGMFAYYTSSPLLILLLLFKKRDFVLFATLLFGIKVVLGAGFCDLFLTNKHDDLNNYDIVLSLCYAFMRYVFAYYQNLMWLDCVVMLPLILSGLDKIFDGKSPLLYCLSLAICTWGNFYIAVMCCIFVVIYFVWQYVDRFGVRLNKKTISVFTLSSIGGGLIPMAMLLPAVLQIFKSKSVGEGELQSLDYNIANLSRQLIVGFFDSENMMKGMPQIYGGMLLLVGVCFYFASSHISKKKKLTSALVGILLVASFLSTNLNLLFHGMTQTVWFPHRHSFLFVIYCIILSAEALRYPVEKLQVAVAFAFSVLLLSCQLVLYRDTISKKNMLLGAALLLFFALTIYLGKQKKGVVIAVSAVALAELVFNSCGILNTLELYSVCDFRNQYDYMEQVKELADQYAVDDFYRIERDYFRTLNDPMLYGYNGISHFDSTQDKIGSTLKWCLGYREYNLTTYAGTNSIAADCLLNIKFTISDKDEEYSYKDKIGDGVYMYHDTIPFIFALTEDGNSTPAMEKYLNNIYSNIAGETVTVVYPKGEFSGENSADDQFFTVDMDTIAKVSHIARNQGIIYSANKNRIDISFDNKDKKYLCLTMPFDENWQVMLNGEKTDATTVLGNFLGVAVPEGEVHITMTYRPKGVLIGCGLSCFGLMLTTGVTAWHKKEKFKDC